MTVCIWYAVLNWKDPGTIDRGQRLFVCACESVCVRWKAETRGGISFITVKHFHKQLQAVYLMYTRVSVWKKASKRREKTTTVWACLCMCVCEWIRANFNYSLEKVICKYNTYQRQNYVIYRKGLPKNKWKIYLPSCHTYTYIHTHTHTHTYIY